MKFNNVSQSWRMRNCSAAPRDLLICLLEEVTRRLPPGSLGHAKGYAQYPGGALFASTTILPPDIGVQEQGKYQGGDIDINLVLIFGELDRAVLNKTLEAAKTHTQTHFGCEFWPKREVYGIE